MFSSGCTQTCRLQNFSLTRQDSLQSPVTSQALDKFVPGDSPAGVLLGLLWLDVLCAGLNIILESESSLGWHHCQRKSPLTAENILRPERSLPGAGTSFCAAAQPAEFKPTCHFSPDPVSGIISYIILHQWINS